LEICEPLSWTFFALLVAVAALFTFLAARIAQREYERKVEVGYKFTKGDQPLNTKTTLKLVAIAFMGAFAAGLAGIGPGTIFNPFFVAIDMHPAVASATGMYVTLFVTLSATINLLINESLNLEYSLLFNIITILGCIPGLYLQNQLVKWTGGRTQFTVMILLIYLIILAVSVLPLNISANLLAHESGESITAFNSYCS